MRKFVIVFLAIVTLSLMALPTMAQDATPTYNADVLATQAAYEAAIDLVPTDQLFPAIEVTDEPDGGVTINIDTQPDATPIPTPQPVTPPDGTVTLNVWQVVVGVVTLLLSGGFVGGAGIVLLVRAIRNDMVLVTAIEGLANSRPDRERGIANKFGEGLREVGDLMVEVTDNIPVASKGATINVPNGMAITALPAVQGAVASHTPQAPVAPTPDSDGGVG